eukprot:3865614-Rhodomonas_salina.2
MTRMKFAKRFKTPCDLARTSQPQVGSSTHAHMYMNTWYFPNSKFQHSSSEDVSLLCTVTNSVPPSTATKRYRR